MAVGQQIFLRPPSPPEAWHLGLLDSHVQSARHSPGPLRRAIEDAGQRHAVVAPIPSASVITAVTVNPGAFRNCRKACLRSANIHSSSVYGFFFSLCFQISFRITCGQPQLGESQVSGLIIEAFEVTPGSGNIQTLLVHAGLQSPKALSA